MFSSRISSARRLYLSESYGSGGCARAFVAEIRFKCTNGSVLDLEMFGDRSHLQIVCDDEMFEPQLLSKQRLHDVWIDRRRRHQATCRSFLDIDVWKTAVADHHHAD